MTSSLLTALICPTFHMKTAKVLQLFQMAIRTWVHSCSLAHRWFSLSDAAAMDGTNNISFHWSPLGAEWSVSVIPPYRPASYDQEQTGACSRDTEPCQQDIQSPVSIWQINTAFLPHFSCSREICGYVAQRAETLIPPVSLFLLIHLELIKQIWKKKYLCWARCAISV